EIRRSVIFCHRKREHVCGPVDLAKFQIYLMDLFVCREEKIYLRLIRTLLQLERCLHDKPCRLFCVERQNYAAFFFDKKVHAFLLLPFVPAAFFSYSSYALTIFCTRGWRTTSLLV